MVTIKDIAKYTNFSRSTVAAVLSGRGEELKIKAATRETINNVAKELGYYQNSLARQMAKGKTNVIGFLSSDLAGTEFTSAILSGIMREANKEKYYAKIFYYSKDDPEKTLAGIIEQRPAGVISFAVLQPNFTIIANGLKKSGIPLLSLNDVKTDHGIFVTTDDSAGINIAVEHLYQLGHRKIGFFDTREAVKLEEPRSEGFLRSIQKYNLPESEIITEFMDNPDIAALTRIIAPKKYTAIVCSTDYHAMRVLQAAAKAGVKVPEELSVTGFADLLSARFCSPPLTTVQQPFIQWGITAVAKLLDIIDEKSVIPAKKKIIEKIPLKLIIRESTAPAISKEKKLKN